MGRPIESSKEVDKQAEYLGELKKLTDLFTDSDDSKKQLAAGLIEDAAYLYAENKSLRSMLKKTGMVRISPNNPMMQKPVEAAKQYRSNVDAYASVIGRLARILDSKAPEEDDDMNEYEDDS